MGHDDEKDMKKRQEGERMDDQGRPVGVPEEIFEAEYYSEITPNMREDDDLVEADENLTKDGGKKRRDEEEEV